jgi:hypothetical protein
MCSDPQKLLSYYSNKVNIYNNDCYIKLPDWNSCPPPPQIYLTPQIVYPPAGPYIPSVIAPIQQPLNYPGIYCDNNPCATCAPCSGAPCSGAPCSGAPCSR